MRVTEVNCKGTSVLVEYHGPKGPQRCFLPRSVIGSENEVADDDLVAGIPYGVPWEEEIRVREVTPAALALALRQHGVWTLDDARQNPTEVLAALQSVYGLVRATIMQVAENYQRRI
jgi:hypothetical protein